MCFSEASAEAKYVVFLWQLHSKTLSASDDVVKQRAQSEDTSQEGFHSNFNSFTEVVEPLKTMSAF